MKTEHKVAIGLGIAAVAGVAMYLSTREELDMEIVQYYLDKHGESGICNMSSNVGSYK